MKITITFIPSYLKQYTFKNVNNAGNFHFRRINTLIQVTCVLSCTSLLTRQTIVMWLYSLHCSWASHSIGFYWSGVVYRWLLRLGPGPKFSSHIVRDAGIGWWRDLITMVRTSLVYVERFRNPRRWQNVNVVGILFL